MNFKETSSVAKNNTDLFGTVNLILRHAGFIKLYLESGSRDSGKIFHTSSSKWPNATAFFRAKLSYEACVAKNLF